LLRSRQDPQGLRFHRPRGGGYSRALRPAQAAPEDGSHRPSPRWLAVHPAALSDDHDGGRGGLFHQRRHSALRVEKSPRRVGAGLLRREFVAPSLVYFLYTSLGAPAHAAKLLAPMML